MANRHLTGYRTADQIISYRCLNTEVDIRPEKVSCYSNFEEAIHGIETFVSSVGLPYPSVVETGGGFHLYWILNEDITQEQWRDWSQKVIALSTHIGFRLDIAGTNKPTQIFRPPQTHNRKYEPAFLVTQTEESKPVSYKSIMNKINSVIESLGIEVIKASKRKVSDNNGDVPLRDWTRIKDECGQMLEGATGSEELWRGMLSVARHCVGGRELCHDLSKGDNRYSEHETDTKIDYLENSGSSPYTCAKFNEINPGLCCDCLHLNRVKSPIVLGIVDISEDDQSCDVNRLPSLVDPLLKQDVGDGEKKTVSEITSEVKEDEYEVLAPSGYTFKLTSQGLVKRKVDAEGNKTNELICKQRIYPIGVIIDTDNYRNKVFNYMWRIELDERNYNDCIVPADTFTSTANILGLFFKFGVNVIRADQFASFAQAMRAFINTARDKLTPIPVVDSLGWNSDDKSMVFGERTVEKHGRVRRSILNPEMESLVSNTLTCRGTIEGWQRAVNPYTAKDKILAQLILATSFGAPIVHFSTINGLIIALVGESGTGKSTMQAVGASVWGHPWKQLQNAVGTQTGDTILSVTRYMGGVSNFPVHLEEISNMSDEGASDLAYLVTQGAEKSRMLGTKEGSWKRSEGLTWKTLVVTSSNPSLRDKINRFKTDSVAETMRIFEIRNLPKIADGSWFKIADTLSEVNENYGVAGERFAKAITRMQDSLKEILRREVNVMNRDLKTDSPERFWVQGMASVLVGAKIAKEEGIFNFDMPALRRYIYAGIEEHRAVKIQISTVGMSLFADMLNELVGETLVVATPAGARMPTEMITQPHSKLSVRVDTIRREMFVSKKAVTTYSKVNKVSVADILDNADYAGYNLVDIKGCRTRMASGTVGVGDPRNVTRAYKFMIPVGVKYDENKIEVEEV